jgi:hypothetical protein
LRRRTIPDAPNLELGPGSSEGPAKANHGTVESPDAYHYTALVAPDSSNQLTKTKRGSTSIPDIFRDTKPTAPQSPGVEEPAAFHYTALVTPKSPEKPAYRKRASVDLPLSGSGAPSKVKRGAVAPRAYHYTALVAPKPAGKPAKTKRGSSSGPEATAPDTAALAPKASSKSAKARRASSDMPLSGSNGPSKAKRGTVEDPPVFGNTAFPAASLDTQATAKRGSSQVPEVARLPRSGSGGPSKVKRGRSA